MWMFVISLIALEYASAVILVELRIFWHVDVHCNLLFVIICMKDKCACLADFFLLQENDEVTICGSSPD